MILLQPISKYLSIATFSLVFIGGIVVVTQYSAGHSKAITNRLNAIQTQLTNLQQEAKKPNEKLDLSGINQDIQKLATLIEDLTSKDNHAITQLVTENRTALSKKLDVLQEVMNSLDKKQHPVKYLPVTALPFKLISIDSIQQVSVVTVSYNFKTIPLEKTDKLAGWEVLSIDYGMQRIEFENSNKERVVVTMKTFLDAHHA